MMLQRGKMNEIRADATKDGSKYCSPARIQVGKNLQLNKEKQTLFITGLKNISGQLEVLLLT